MWHPGGLGLIGWEGEVEGLWKGVISRMSWRSIYTKTSRGHISSHQFTCAQYFFPLFGPVLPPPLAPPPFPLAEVEPPE